MMERNGTKPVTDAADPWLLTPAEAAKRLNISPRALWALTAPRGPVPCVRLGKAVRYDPRALRGWIEDQLSSAEQGEPTSWR